MVGNAIVRGALAAMLLSSLVAPPAAARPETVEQVKPAIVSVGTFQRTRSPAFQFLGTGFAIGDGTVIATNAHVLPQTLNTEQRETLAILLPGNDAQAPQFREVQRAGVDLATDLGLLKLVGGTPLPAMRLRQGGRVREGETYLFTGYPIGNLLGPFPVTHRALLASIPPIAIPTGRAGELEPRLIRRLSSGPLAVYQLDATAYPGSSGSPLYDPESGDVVGIINMVLVRNTRESAVSQPTGITYAIPVHHLLQLLSSLR
jgi:serine protease Do